jgi:hypothetical protein
MSGYAEAMVGSVPLADADTHFVQKPFKPEVLLELLERVLGG